MLNESEKINSFESEGIKIPIEVMPDLPEVEKDPDGLPEKTPKEVLEEKRSEFARLDLEAEKWVKERDKKNFWDKDQEYIPATKQYFGERENEEYFQKKKEYTDALRDYRDKRFEEIDSQNITDEEKQKRKNGVIKETVVIEANLLYDTKISLSIERRDESLKERAKELSAKVINLYRDLDWKYKIGFAGALFGVGTTVGAAGGAVGLALATGAFTGIKAQRILGGAALAVGLEAGLHRRQEKKAEREVAEMFAKKLKEKMADINNEMSEKLFELEGRKSVEMYKRYILSGAAGFFVGSGAVGKAILGTAEMFGITGERVSEVASGVTARVSGWFGLSEAIAGDVSEEVLEGGELMGGASETEVAEEGGEFDFEISKLEIQRDEQGNIEWINDPIGNIVNMDRDFLFDTFVKPEHTLSSDEGKGVLELLRCLKVNQVGLERIRDDFGTGSPEYEWFQSNPSNRMEELKVKYGHLLNMEKVETAFAVKEAPEVEIAGLEYKTEPIEGSDEAVAEKEEVVRTQEEIPEEAVGTLEDTTEPKEEVVDTVVERDVVEVEEEIPGEAVEEVEETSLESVVFGLEKDISELSDKVTKTSGLEPEKVIVAEIEADEPDVLEETQEVQPLTEEETRFVSDIKEGSSVWETTKGILKDNFGEDFNSLNEAQQNNLIKQIEVRVAEDPAKFGLEGVDDIHKVRPGQTLNLSPLTEGETMTRMLELARGVTEQIESVVEPEPAPEPAPEETAEDRILQDTVESETVKSHPVTEKEPVSEVGGVEFEEPFQTREDATEGVFDSEEIKPHPIIEDKPVSEVGGVEFEEATSEYPMFASEIEQGSSVWKTTEGILRDNFGDDFNDLDEARQTHLIDQIKNKIDEDPAKFGLFGVDDINQVQIGQRLDLSPVMEGETMARMFESSANLNQEDITRIINNNEKIEVWVKENPNKALTTERVQEIIKGTGEERLGIDSEVQTLKRIEELYDISPDSEEAIKGRLDVIESLDLDVSTKKALADLYFENWNKEGISQERVEGVLSEFLGESYEDNKEFFRDGGNICKEENGDIEIALEKTGLSDQKGKELLITVSPQGTISLDGPSEYWNIGEKSLNDRSLAAVEKRLIDFANA